MKKVILVTGISSGFGKRDAELLAKRGHIVYGTIRTDCEMYPSIKVLKMDIIDFTSIDKAIAQVIQNEGRIDVLINNAGMHLGGPIEEAPTEWYSRQMETNFNGTVHVLQTVLPYMRKQAQGTIINISSIGGLMGLPFQPFYSACKFAIEGLSEALRMELKPFNIKVIVVNPGDFHTSNTANRKNITVAGGPYEEQFKKSLAQIEKDENGGGDPIILARKMVKIVESKHPHNRYIIASFDDKLAVFLKRILPIGIFQEILGSHYCVK